MNNAVSASNAKEPPSCPQGQLFVVGQDCHGNWVVQDPNGIRGGLFVGREAALRYLRREVGDQPVMMSSNVVEFDLSRKSVLPQPRPIADEGMRRRVA